jgi:hypothetical protein
MKEQIHQKCLEGGVDEHNFHNVIGNSERHQETSLTNRVGNFQQKIFPRKTDQIIISDGILAVPSDRKFAEFRSEPFCGRETTLNSFCRTKIEANSRNSVQRKVNVTPNSILWNKNRNTLSECRSKPFRGRENNSEQNAEAENFKNSIILLGYFARNEHFLPRNNGNPCESIPRNFFGMKFCSQP